MGCELRYPDLAPGAACACRGDNPVPLALPGFCRREGNYSCVFIQLVRHPMSTLRRAFLPAGGGACVLRPGAACTDSLELRLVLRHRWTSAPLYHTQTP